MKEKRMDVEEAIRRRRSVRQYTKDPVSATEIREMLSLASQAPSISNRQMWRFVVVTDPTLRGFLADMVARRIDEMATWYEFENNPRRIEALKKQALHFRHAPVVIFLVNLGYRSPLNEALVTRGMKLWEADRLFGYPDIQSISAVTAYLTLLADARGYATCWMTEPLLAKKDLQASLELKSGEEIVALLTMGKSAESLSYRNRRPIDEIIEWR